MQTIDDLIASRISFSETTAELKVKLREEIKTLIEAHLEAQREAIANDTDNIVCGKGYNAGCMSCYGGGCENPIVCKDSVINAYPNSKIL